MPARRPMAPTTDASSASGNDLVALLRQLGGAGLGQLGIGGGNIMGMIPQIVQMLLKNRMNKPTQEEPPLPERRAFGPQ